MENLTFENGLSYHHHEIQISRTEKTHFGRTGLFGSTLGYPTPQVNYISLVKSDGTTREFSVCLDTYTSIKQQQESIILKSNEFMYLWVSENIYGELEQWQLFKSGLTLDHLNQLYQKSYHFDSVIQFISLIENLRVKSLKTFGLEIMQNQELMEKFISIGASKNHHHSFPGGLLIHSLETAMITAQNIKLLPDEFSVHEREVTILAALFHDIGKTLTLGTQVHTNLGHMVHHDKLTLLVLANALVQLDKTWQKGAETLQYLLTWNPSDHYCKFVGGNIIKTADQLSTSWSLRRMAFADKPQYFNFSSIKTGLKTHYVNRL